MEPITIASAVVALLAPFVSKAFEEFAGEGGKRAWEIAENVWSRIRGTQSHAALTETASSFEKHPSERSAAFQTALMQALSADEDLRRDLAAAVDQFRELKPELRIVQKVEAARQVVALRARQLGSSRDVRVNQQVGHAEDVIGVELGDVE